MSTATRLSAAAVSIVVISAALGFELGAAANSYDSSENVDFSGAGAALSPGAGSHRNVKTRSIAGFQSAFDSARTYASSSYPMANPVGPMASDTRVKVRVTRSIAPACQMALN